jgi:hypothetical protein
VLPLAISISSDGKCTPASVLIFWTIRIHLIDELIAPFSLGPLDEGPPSASSWRAYTVKDLLIGVETCKKPKNCDLKSVLLKPRYPIGLKSSSTVGFPDCLAWQSP